MSSTTHDLAIVRIPGESYSYTNLFYHNKDDLGNDVYFSVNDTVRNRLVVYKSVAHTQIPKGSIGIGRIVRTQLNLKLGDVVKFNTTANIVKRFVQLLKINVEIFRNKKSDNNKSSSNNDNANNANNANNAKKDEKDMVEPVMLHPENVRAAIIKALSDFYFNPGQHLVINLDGIDLIMKVMLGSHSGFLNNNSKIEIISDDLLTHIVDEAGMSKELFQANFSFESIGIGGLDTELSSILRRAMSTRAISNETVNRLGIKHVKGLILFGPPGTGKTLIARNLGKLLSKTPPIVINGPELLNKYVGQSEENLRNIFKPAKDSYLKDGDKAALHIFIFDELDAICRQRSASTSSNVGDSMVNQLLTLIDGVHQLPNIFVIGMTNRLDLIDEALIRPGRLEIKIKISLPDEKGRLQILRIHTDKMRNNNIVESLDLDHLVNRTKNFSGAEIEAVVKNAASYAISDFLTCTSDNGSSNSTSIRNNSKLLEKDIVVTKDHFEKAVDEIVPSFGNKEIGVGQDLQSLDETNLATCVAISELIHGSSTSKDAASNSKMVSILLTMSPKTGKTHIMKHLCKMVGKIGYIKMIQPIDLLKKNEMGKLDYLTHIIESAYETNQSLVIIDDVDIMLDFIDIRGHISFSNRLYQVIRTILKTIPKHRFYFVCTTSSLQLTDFISHDFNVVLPNPPSRSDTLSCLAAQPLNY